MSTITRRQLYAAGEAFGESCTRREAGRTIYGGGSSNSSQEATQVDKRVAVQGGVGLSGDGSSVVTNSTTHYTVTDGGIAKNALATVDKTNARAFDSIDKSTVQLGDGYELLISAADKLFARGETLIGQTQQHVADAWQQANTDGQGTIDNKTIIALAVAAGATAAAIAYTRRGK